MNDACRFPGCRTGEPPMDAYGSKLCLEHGCQANDELDRHRTPGEMLTWEKACSIVGKWLERMQPKRAQGER